MLNRRGVTLVELLVTVVVGGVALSLVAAISLRQRRALIDLADAAALSIQLRDAADILPIDLRVLSSAAGDIREATDTSLEIRGTIASAVVCDTISNGAVLVPAVANARTFAGYGTPIDIGDTAWVLAVRDSAEAWTPRRIVSIATIAPGRCAAVGPSLDSLALGMRRPTLGLEGATDPAVIGMPIRVTRARRYSVYRAADGLWYLGARDWNVVALRFNSIQPVSGPFLSPASGGLRFLYFDAAGAEIGSPVSDTRVITTVRIDLRGKTRHAASASRDTRVDSTNVWVLLRNRQ